MREVWRDSRRGGERTSQMAAHAKAVDGTSGSECILDAVLVEGAASEDLRIGQAPVVQNPSHFLGKVHHVTAVQSNAPELGSLARHLFSHLHRTAGPPAGGGGGGGE